jgi:hypothetical protein
VRPQTDLQGDVPVTTQSIPRSGVEGAGPIT